jgi:hypothetical protein
VGIDRGIRWMDAGETHQIPSIGLQAQQSCGAHPNDPAATTICTHISLTTTPPTLSGCSPLLRCLSDDGAGTAPFDRDGAIVFPYNHQIVEMNVAMVRFTEQRHHFNIG